MDESLRIGRYEYFHATQVMCLMPCGMAPPHQPQGFSWAVILRWQLAVQVALLLLLSISSAIALERMVRCFKRQGTLRGLLPYAGASLLGMLILFVLVPDWRKNSEAWDVGGYIGLVMCMLILRRISRDEGREET
jgi:hypothetical protein